MESPEDIRRGLVAVRSRLSARAAGAWMVSGDRLEQVAFDPAPDLPREVAERFAAATRSVELAHIDLAIARAASTGRIVVSIAADLPSEIGSGFWLRAFGAVRSVAVPIVEPGDKVAMVVSVALGPEPDAESVSTMLRQEFDPSGG